ncbi:hypothetical protein Tco_0643291 [Tanacetum coccineum]
MIVEKSGTPCDNHDLSRLDNQSIERERFIGIGFVLNFVKFISFTFGDKEMISVIEAIMREIEEVHTLKDGEKNAFHSDEEVETGRKKQKSSKSRKRKKERMM